MEPVDSGPAADPVSIGLAYSTAKQFSVPESKLSYGFDKQPLDDLPKVTHSKIPEEKLWKLNGGKIMELKPSSDNSEDDEFEVDGELDNGPDSRSAFISYGDLGYAPAAVKNPRFRSFVNDPIVIESKKCNRRDYSCGFKPGKVSQNAEQSMNNYFYGGEDDYGGL